MTQCKICGSFTKRNICRECKKKYARIEKYKAYRLKPRRRTGSSQQMLFRRIRKCMKKQYKVMQEMTFDFNLCKRYDIIIPDIKLIIEYQGIQHVKWTKFFHKKYSDFLEYVKNDKEKRDLYSENCRKVKHILCWEEEQKKIIELLSSI